MAGKKKKKLFCGDMFNSLENTDKEFHWSKAYSGYSNLPVDDTSSKHLRSIGLVKARCMPKHFSVPKLVLLCSKCLNSTNRIIHVGDNTVPPISLSPVVF